MKQKYIFDLDGTLLDGDFSKEEEYFKSELTTTESEIFIPQIFNLLTNYEQRFIKYDIDLLSKYMSSETSISITPSIIRGWIECNKDMDDTIIEGVIETLDELKMRDKDLIVLTNWFSETQSSRLKKQRIDIYFDEVYGGEHWLKPYKDAYINACGYTPMELCVMIGDNYEKDFLGPKRIGMDSIYFNREKSNTNDINSIKSLKKIKDIY